VDAQGHNERVPRHSAGRARLTEGEPQLSGSTVKQCCATFYGSDAARFLLGESFHPGGTQLTHELAQRMGLGSHSRVLDVASGRGTSALYLAATFGCEVVGIDFSEENTRLAQAAAADADLPGTSPSCPAMPSTCRSLMRAFPRLSASARFAPSRTKPLLPRSSFACSLRGDGWDLQI